MLLVTLFIGLAPPLAIAMSSPSFHHVLTLLAGRVLAAGWHWLRPV